MVPSKISDQVQILISFFLNTHSSYRIPPGSPIIFNFHIFSRLVLSKHYVHSSLQVWFWPHPAFKLNEHFRLHSSTPLNTKDFALK